MSSTFHFSVKGQEGYIPQLGLGTATLYNERCVSSVVAALKAGYRHLDTALVYQNQEAVGEAIRKSGIPRADIFVTSKVAFFFDDPGVKASPLYRHNGDNNLKGCESSSIELCLKQLGFPYVDLLLIHNPCTSLAEYKAAFQPHYYELMNKINPKLQLDGENIKSLIQGTLLRRIKEAYSKSEVKKAALDARRKSWKALENAKREGKCRYIGVSNYPAELLLEMKEYADIIPAVNQLEFHPRFASPKLRKVAKELGVVLTGYGTGNSVKLELGQTLQDRSKIGHVLASIATRIGKSPMLVVLRWTLQSGVVAIPRSGSVLHIKENLKVFDFELSTDDMSSLNRLNEDYPYYWDPVASVLTCNNSAMSSKL